MMVMMTLLKLFCMPKHPWNKELSIYTATQRKTSSTTADIAHVTTAVQSMTSSKVVCLPPCEFDICLGCVLQMPIAWWRCRTRRARLRSLPTSRSTQARAQFFRKESRVPVDKMGGKQNACSAYLPCSSPPCARMFYGVPDLLEATL